ncbi:MAG: hypothetical protein KKD21_01845 [Proteobacteria bacterium]|nr:hypothetical protein [Pseudomonadota bacterium]MBU1695771.1 hypothetical protein [Pseudomonadota bacterium]
MKKKFAASIRRKEYSKREVGNTNVCPECRSKMENESHTYLVMIKNSNDDVESFMMGNNFGYFCLKCPIIVIDYESFSDLLVSANKVSHNSKFIVAGLVDLEAIPEEKSHIPIGDDDNPIPLVEFLRTSKKISTSNIKKKKRIKKARKKKK